MYKFYLLLLLVISMSFCNQQKKTYYLKEKWTTAGGRPFKVKQQPKKIIEYFYTQIDSIDQKDLPAIGSYDEYYFNREGDLMQRNFVLGASVTHITYHYTIQGYTSEMTIQDPSGTKKILTIFEQTKDGKYLESRPDEAYKRYIWYQYKNKGQEIITVQYFGNNKTKQYVRRHSFYNGDDLEKEINTIEDNKGKKTTEHLYYYDTRKSPDSIITRSDNASKRIIFKKNKYGDPTAQYEMNGNDTSKYKYFGYLYDDKGNWVRQFEKEHTADLYNRQYGNTLIIRKIEY